MRIRVGLALALAVAAQAQAPALRAQPQQDFDKVVIEAQPVAKGLHMLLGSGGNIGVSTGADGVILIDDQYAPLHPKILAAVKALDERPLRFVVNTHWHFDHTGGNELFAKGGALLVAHDAARKRLATGMVSKVFEREIPPAPPGALPVVTFSEELTFHWNGDELHVFHVPNAHTDGDAIIHFRKANALHTGDVFINGRYPFLDLESGGSLAGVIAASDRILAQSDAKTRIIPGHGAQAGREELMKYRDMLVMVRDRVSKALDAGAGIDALLAKSPLADLDATWGGGFVTPEGFLRTVVASLEAERARR